MYIICPDPERNPEWNEYAMICHRTGDIDHFVRLVAPKVVEGSIFVYALEQTIKQIAPPQFAKYQVTKNGEILPL